MLCPKSPNLKVRRGSKNAQAQKSKGLGDDDEDDDIMGDLKVRIAAYNLSASPDHLTWRAKNQQYQLERMNPVKELRHKRSPHFEVRRRHLTMRIKEKT